jgi:acetolactate synthase-1/2/3 large subunit
MGFGLPAAIGAKFARPDHIVIDIDGDASFCMTMAEVATAVQFKTGIKMVIINNGEQGMITQLQQAYYNGRICFSKQHNPNFFTLVESMGGQGRRCSDRKDLTAGVQWLLDTLGVVCLEVVTVDNVPVEPNVPAGKPLDAILPEKRAESN